MALRLGLGADVVRDLSPVGQAVHLHGLRGARAARVRQGGGAGGDAGIGWREVDGEEPMGTSRSMSSSSAPQSMETRGNESESTTR